MVLRGPEARWSASGITPRRRLAPVRCLDNAPHHQGGYPQADEIEGDGFTTAAAGQQRRDDEQAHRQCRGEPLEPPAGTGPRSPPPSIVRITLVMFASFAVSGTDVCVPDPRGIRGARVVLIELGDWERRTPPRAGCLAQETERRGREKRAAVGVTLCAFTGRRAKKQTRPGPGDGQRPGGCVK